MQDVMPRAEDLLINRQVFGLVVVLVLALAALGSRLFLREVFADSSPGWRLCARSWAIAVVTFTGWTSIFDNWMQLVGEPFRISHQWASERIVTDPVALEIRIVTYILLAITVILTAAIFARHVGGYGLQISTLIIASILWIPLFVIRQRLDIMVHDGVSDHITNVGDFAGLLPFWALSSALNAGMVVLSFMALTLAVAPIMTLMLDVFHLRIARMTKDADDFFGAVHQQAGEYEEISLKDRWRPIQRPS